LKFFSNGEVVSSWFIGASLTAVHDAIPTAMSRVSTRFIVFILKTDVRWYFILW
jgi:hypothetical protein